MNATERRIEEIATKLRDRVLSDFPNCPLSVSDFFPRAQTVLIHELFQRIDTLEKLAGLVDLT